MNYFEHYRAELFCMLLLLLAAGCEALVPATVPPQLFNTPGAPIVLDDDQLQIGDWRVPLPIGWKVVKNRPSIEPLGVVFVSPDETVLIWLSETPLALSDFHALQHQAVWESSGGSLYLYAEAPAPDDPQLQAVWADLARQSKNNLIPDRTS